MAVYYYNITNNTSNPIRLPSNQVVDATSTVSLTLLEFRTYCEQDDEFLEYVYNGDISVSFGPGYQSVHIPIPSDGIHEVLRNTDKIKGIEVDDSGINPSYFLTYRSGSGKIEYQPVAQSSLTTPDTTAVLWIDTLNSLICFWDEARGKWLATVKNVFAFGKASLSRNTYLNVSGIAPSSANVGYFVFRYATITGVWCKVASMTGASDPYMEIRTILDGTLFTFEIPDPGLVYYNNELNIDIDKGRVLQCWVRDRFVDPVVQVEMSWRCGI